MHFNHGADHRISQSVNVVSRFLKPNDFIDLDHFILLVFPLGDLGVLGALGGAVLFVATSTAIVPTQAHESPLDPSDRNGGGDRRDSGFAAASVCGVDRGGVDGGGSDQV